VTAQGRHATTFEPQSIAKDCTMRHRVGELAVCQKSKELPQPLGDLMQQRFEQSD
jgi:hypothetical protein